jgi:hypothetical protein
LPHIEKSRISPSLPHTNSLAQLIADAEALSNRLTSQTRDFQKVLENTKLLGEFVSDPNIAFSSVDAIAVQIQQETRDQEETNDPLPETPKSTKADLKRKRDLHKDDPTPRTITRRNLSSRLHKDHS